MASSSGDKSYFSKQKSICGYCDKEIRRDRLGLVGLIDIYDQFKICSKAVQNSDILPWEAIEIIINFQERLDNMSIPENPVNVLLWPNLFSLLNSEGFQEFFTYSGIPLSFETDARPKRGNLEIIDPSDSKPIIDLYFQKLKNFCKILSEKISERFFNPERGRIELLQLLSKIFNFSKFLSDSKTKENFNYKNFSIDEISNPIFIQLLTQMNITFDEFFSQYNLLKKRLLESASFSKGTLTTLQILDVFLRDPELYTDIEGILRVCLTLSLQTHNECIVESMCSKVQYHARPERNLARNTLNEEIFVSWQGPPLTESTKLIEHALDLRFGSRQDWHFVTTSRKDKLSKWTRSQVVDRVMREEKESIKLPFLQF